MPLMKTPGVYVVEKNAFPNSAVEVATAVPAFIGYTELADNKGKSLLNRPWRITSMAEFHDYFGCAPNPKFEIAEYGGEAPAGEPAFTVGGKQYCLTLKQGKYLLYHSMMLFYANGGGPCYVISVGNYSDDIEGDKLSKAIDLLEKEQEPTMVVIPEAVLLPAQADCISVQQAVLAHCGGKMRNRFALLDVWEGYKDRRDPSGDCIENFRGALGINYLDYAAAYYPWIRANIVKEPLSYENLDNKDLLQTLLKVELGVPDTLPTVDDADPPAVKAQKVKTLKTAEAVVNVTSDWADIEPGSVDDHKRLLNKSLSAISGTYNAVVQEMKNQLNLLPPSPAMAGIYTMVDNTQGVWRAPANVSLSSVIAPAVTISHDEQEDLNVTTQGKSINAIRSFIGEGTLVWGARTLDGNSLDWRYINVRRTMLMLEESIKLATKAYVFENNVSSTWVTVKSMINSFLGGIWKRGGLAGASPTDAFGVFCGLGETMTPEDILEGILRVTVLVAMVRPAEFIEITFQQQMQKS